MASKPKPWPINAASARNQACEANEKARRIMMDVLADGEVEPDELGLLGLALGTIVEGEIILIQQGAPVVLPERAMGVLKGRSD